MTQLIAIDAEALKALQEEVAEIKAILKAKPQERWLNVSDAAKALNCSRATVYNRINSGFVETRDYFGKTQVKIEA